MTIEQLTELSNEAEIEFPGIGLIVDYEDLFLTTVYKSELKVSTGESIFDQSKNSDPY